MANLRGARGGNGALSLWGEDGYAADDVEITVNEQYAAKYEHGKRKQEMDMLREKYGDTIDESDSSDGGPEDENGELLTPALDVQILNTIGLIRGKNEKIYDKTTEFFNETELERAQRELEEKRRQAKRDQPMTVADYHRQRIQAKANASDGKTAAADDDDDSDTSDEDDVAERRERAAKKREMTYTEEQERVKQDFKNAFKDIKPVDDKADEFADGGLFMKKAKTNADLEAEEEDYRNFLLQAVSEQEGGKALGDWQKFKHGSSGKAKRAELNNEDAFLMDFVLNRRWMDRPSKAAAADRFDAESEDEVPEKNIVSSAPIDDSADEEEVEKCEDFEAAYNFRFEEPGSASIITYSRNIENSLRRPDNSRKEKRKTVAERKQEEAQQKMEELKRLKNLKKAEIYNKLQSIREITGNTSKSSHECLLHNERCILMHIIITPAVGFDEIDLDEEFDPNNFDQKLHTVFNDDYYDTKDAIKPEFGNDIDVTDIIGGLDMEDDELAGCNDDADENVVGGDRKQESGKRSRKRQRGRRGADDNGYDYELDFNMDAECMEEAPIESEIVPRKPIDPKSTKTLAKVQEQATEKAGKVNVNDYLNEYYQLDYEDIIGDLPTRFKYKPVKKKSFGMSPVEILLSEDTDLNAKVSLKKLAPYRENRKRPKF